MSRQTHPRSADVRQGTILWLPSYDEIVNNQDSVSDVIWGGACDPAVYNHPILVLSRPAVAPDTIHFLLMTSFNGQDIRTRFSNRRRRNAPYQNYLAIAPSPVHPLMVAGNKLYQNLYFADGQSMPRNGYLKISEVYSMQWADARSFRHNKRDVPWLDEACLRQVVTAVHELTRYTPAQQHSFGLVDDVLLRTKSTRESFWPYLLCGSLCLLALWYFYQLP